MIAIFFFFFLGSFFFNLHIYQCEFNETLSVDVTSHVGRTTSAKNCTITECIIPKTNNPNLPSNFPVSDRAETGPYIIKTDSSGYYLFFVA